MVPTPLPPLGESRFRLLAHAPLCCPRRRIRQAPGRGAGAGMLTAGLFITDPQAGGAQLALHRRPETNGGEFTQATHAVLVMNTLLILAAL